MPSASEPTNPALPEAELPATGACPVCGGHEVKIGEKVGVYRPRKFSYLKCCQCRYTRVHPFPGYDIYNAEYYRGEGADPYVNYENEFRDYATTERVREFEDLFRLAERHVAKMPSRGAVRWLDFGCGSGAFLKFLRDKRTLAGRDLEVIGFDVGAFVERLRATEGCQVLDMQGLAKATPFDVVSCIEVVEHVREVDAVFADLARALASGGLLLLTTGNMESEAARKAGMSYRYLIPEIHISLFTPQVLTTLYQRNGLVPVAVRYRGVVEFKVLKSLNHPLLRSMARIGLRLPFLLRWVDRYFGVSAMPCAIKPGVPAVLVEGPGQ